MRTDAVDGNGDTTVGFYIDDVYQSLAVQASHPFVDVARVEIARGPQGTLFGRNTFGGAISVVNALPGREPEAGIDITVGNYNRVQTKAFASVPISDTLGLRLAGMAETRDPYVKNVLVPGNDIYDRKTGYLRGTLRWTPSDRVEVILRGTYWHEGGTGAGAYGYKQGGLLVDPATGLGSLTGTPLYFYTANKDGVADINGFDVGRQLSTGPYSGNRRSRPARGSTNMPAMHKSAGPTTRSSCARSPATRHSNTSRTPARRSVRPTPNTSRTATPRR